MKLDRKKFESDEAFCEAMVDGELEWMRNERWKSPYGTDIRNRFTLIGPGWQCAHLPQEFTSWGSNEEKESVKAKIAYLARATSAHGVMFASDMRFLNSDDFIHHFRLTTPTNREQFAKEYGAIMKKYDYSIANLPRHLWSECIGVVLKTPTKAYSKVSGYTRGSEGRVMFTPAPVRPEMAFEAQVIHDWWTIPDDDPNLLEAMRIAIGFLRAIKQTA